MKGTRFVTPASVLVGIGQGVAEIEAGRAVRRPRQAELKP
jgi:hypothetical protein